MTVEQPPDRQPEENGGMTLARASWSITAAAFFIVAVIMLVEGYIGYAIVTAVIALAAAINLL